MPRRKLIFPALAAIASATTLWLPAAASAVPIGPCADVPFIGVCVPASGQPAPPPQQSSGETAFILDAGSGVLVVN